MKMFEKFKNWIKKLFSLKNESINYPYCSEYPYDKFNENNLSSSPIILYVKFTHTGKATGVADPEFKVGTIDLSSIDINKDYLPRYINAFVNKYSCVISLRTTNNENIYDIYYDGNAIPESVGATNFVVKFNQIIGFKN